MEESRAFENIFSIPSEVASKIETCQISNFDTEKQTMLGTGKNLLLAWCFLAFFNMVCTVQLLEPFSSNYCTFQLCSPHILFGLQISCVHKELFGFVSLLQIFIFFVRFQPLEAITCSFLPEAIFLWLSLLCVKKTFFCSCCLLRVVLLLVCGEARRLLV